MKAGKPIVWYAFNRNATLSDVVSNKQSENDGFWVDRHRVLQIGALTNICFTYGGGMACFTFASEVRNSSRVANDLLLTNGGQQMKNPNDFKKSYALVQVGSVIVYVLIGSLVYVYGGQVSLLDGCGR